MLDVEVLGWCGYMWSAVVRPVGCNAKFSETLSRGLMVEKLTFSSRATALVDIQQSALALHAPSKTATSVALTV